MRRYEFVMSEAIAEDFLFLCKSAKVGASYTRIDNVYGAGLQNPKMGDEVWPQVNSMFIIVEKENDDIYKRILETLRNDFPNEGIFCSAQNCDVL